MQAETLGVGFHYDQEIPVQKSHPYRVGGLFRLLDRIEDVQKSCFGLFRLPMNQPKLASRPSGPVPNKFFASP